MADNYTQFSCLFDVGSAANAAAAMLIRAQLDADLERDEGVAIGFDLAIAGAGGPGVLWISSDDHGEPEHVLAFVVRCAEAFDLQGMWGFCWAETCSRLRVDEFGGGAHLVDLSRRTCSTWINLREWVLQHTEVVAIADAEGEPTSAGISDTGGAEP